MAQKVNILDSSGKKTGTVDVSDGVLGVTANAAVVRQALNRFMNNQRQGSHSTKGRSDVRGSNAKPWRQKGTGRARAGTRKSPIWRGGGVTFGPTPRSYNQRLNHKMNVRALTAALSDMQRDGRLFVVESIEVSEPKTRLMAQLIEKLGAPGRVLLLFDPGAKTENGDYSEATRNVFLSARNLQYVTPLAVNNLNIYDLLSHDSLVMTRGALESLEERYG